MQVGDLVATMFSLKYYPNSLDLGIVVGENPPAPFEDYYKYVEVQWNSGIKTTEKTEKLKVLSHG
tara:strand:+ start:27073 stop:27267 length:195 start_codon:yes stop_codon:yes gene_type:complete